MTTNRMGYLPRYLQFMESWKLVGSLTHSPSCPKLCTSALIYAGPNSPASRRKLQCLTSGQAQLEKAASGEAGPYPSALAAMLAACRHSWQKGFPTSTTTGL